jgi:endonuclease YncB( thermonuclease family)
MLPPFLTLLIARISIDRDPTGHTVMGLPAGPDFHARSGKRTIGRLSSISLSLLVLVTTLLSAPVAAGTVEDWDCSPFDSWEWAQSAFEQAERASEDEWQSPIIDCDHLPRGPAPAHWMEAIPTRATGAIVTRVIDGDTIEVLIIDEEGLAVGELLPVRLVLIDTPETRDPRKPVECFGQEATEWVRELLDRPETVWLEVDVSDTDQFNRLLRYVWFELENGQIYLLNEAIARSGFGVLSTYPPDVALVDEIRDAERFAYAHGLGLWEACGGSNVPLAETTPPELDEPPVLPTVVEDGEPGSIEEGTASFIELRALSSPVPRGSNAYVEIETSPGTSCTITVTYKSGPSAAQGLEPMRADATGRVAWSWTVGTSTTPGEWPITIQCNGQILETAFEVI